MEIIPLLSTIIVVSTIITIILAIASYLMYKIRERRRPWKESQKGKPPFFRRYMINNTYDSPSKK